MMWICWIFGHKFKEFRVTEWGFPYNMGFWKQFDHCLRCGKSKEGATMKNQIEWAKDHLERVKQAEISARTNLTLGGAELEFYRLARAIIADAEGGDG